MELPIGGHTFILSKNGKSRRVIAIKAEIGLNTLKKYSVQVSDIRKSEMAPVQKINVFGVSFFSIEIYTP